jgi:error-prone DNA polymerase
VPERRILQDVVTCIREGTTIDAAGFRRERFADRHLKPPEEMARLFARHADAVARSLEIVDRCRFSLSELRYQYPDEVDGPDQTPQQKLEQLVRGACRPAIPMACRRTWRGSCATNSTSSPSLRTRPTS